MRGDPAELGGVKVAEHENDRKKRENLPARMALMTFMVSKEDLLI